MHYLKIFYTTCRKYFLVRSQVQYLSVPRIVLSVQLLSKFKLKTAKHYCRAYCYSSDEGVRFIYLIDFFIATSAVDFILAICPNISSISLLAHFTFPIKRLQHNFIAEKVNVCCK